MADETLTRRAAPRQLIAAATILTAHGSSSKTHGPTTASARRPAPICCSTRTTRCIGRPWGAEALAAAKAADKPILLSVGYAACHWCHVMAHESFENPEIAALMNEHFVNIKVDREERPDLDAIYQHALALMGEQGGWPLTMFLTPDGEPFWGGTYFPPEPRWGRPGFPQVLRGDRATPIATRPRQGREERRGAARGAAAARPAASAATAIGPPNCSTASPSGCCARSIRSMAASAPRRNSRNAASSSCCGAPGSARGRRPIATP